MGYFYWLCGVSFFFDRFLVFDKGVHGVLWFFERPILLARASRRRELFHTCPNGIPL